LSPTALKSGSDQRQAVDQGPNSRPNNRLRLEEPAARPGGLGQQDLIEGVEMGRMRDLGRWTKDIDSVLVF
jgi:hypothetical protein